MHFVANEIRNCQVNIYSLLKCDIFRSSCIVNCLELYWLYISEFFNLTAALKLVYLSD